MQLPDFLQPHHPFRLWAMALLACAIAMLPPRTRRIGGILFVAVAFSSFIALSLNSVFQSFLPH